MSLRIIAENCDSEPEVGPDLVTKEGRKPRVLIGWKHQNDTPEGHREGRIWAWVSDGYKNPKLQVYDENFNRSPFPGVERHCGPANFTMIRMFHPYWCLGNRIPRDMDSDDKKMCRRLYREFKHKYDIERGLAAAVRGSGSPSQAIHVATNTEMDGLFVDAYTRGDGEREREQNEGGLTDILGSERSQSNLRTSSSPPLALEDFEARIYSALSAHNASMAPNQRRRQTNPHHHRNNYERMHRHMSNAAAIHSNRRKERAPREQVTGVEEVVEDMIKEEEDVDMMPLDSITEESQAAQDGFTRRPSRVGNTSPAAGVESPTSLSQGRQNGLGRRLSDVIAPRSVTRRHSERPTIAQVNGSIPGLANRAQSEKPNSATAYGKAQQRACDGEVKKEGQGNWNGSAASGGNQEMELPVWGTGTVVLE